MNNEDAKARRLFINQCEKGEKRGRRAGILINRLVDCNLLNGNTKRGELIDRRVQMEARDFYSPVTRKDDV